jgi:hypothetical protein
MATISTMRLMIAAGIMMIAMMNCTTHERTV